MCTDRGIRWGLRSRARFTARDLILSISALLLLLTSGGLAIKPASAERVDPTDHSMLYRLWARTDLPVIERRTSRAWIWGEESISPLVAEPNADGVRLVQYFEKGGMQFNADPVYAMASPLAREMLTGQLASGHVWEPARTSIAGDPDDQNGPTYASFNGLRDAPPAADGAVLTETIDRQGNRSSNDRLAEYGVTAAHRITYPGLDHQIASPFWEFIQSSGLVYEAARFVDEPIFEDRWSMIGLPLTEAYWSRVKFGGEEIDVLVQIFERRVLTYMPHAPDGWRVQFANTGRHYLDWRFGGEVPSSLIAGQDALPVSQAPDYSSLQTELIDLLAGAGGQNAITVLDMQTGHSISINGDRRQLAACTIKIPIAIAIAQDISAGKYTAADVEHLVIPAMGPSTTWHARELLRITGDGDIGAGIHRANEIMGSYGIENSLMTHPPGYWGEEHGYLQTHGETENWLTTDDLAKMLAGIWKGEGLTSAERNYVLWSLTLATPFLDAAFRAPLPADIASFHKIGVLYEPQNTWNDAGIVVLERNGQEYAYVVAFLSGRNITTYLNGYYLNQAVNARVWQTFSNVP